MTSRRSVALLLAAATALLLTACTGQQGDARPMPSTSPDPVALAALASGDGSLRLATVLDQAGAASGVSAAEIAGVQLAVREINEQGGFAGADVLVVHRSAASEPAALLADIAARGIDVVLWGHEPQPTAAFLDPLQLTATTVVRLAEPSVTPDDAFAARLRSADPGLTSVQGGAEAYDTTIRIALAATFAKNDSGGAIAASLGSTTGGSFACTSWGECIAALADGVSIDYTGITGNGGRSAAADAASSPSKKP